MFLKLSIIMQYSIYNCKLLITFPQICDSSYMKKIFYKQQWYTYTGLKTSTYGHLSTLLF